MGYIKHNAIIVTGWKKEKVEEAHLKAREIFDEELSKDDVLNVLGSSLVSEIIPSLVNGDCTFFIAPDGSKKGWSTSNCANDARDRFIEYLNTIEYLDYVEIKYGGDDYYEKITRSKGKYLNE